MPAKRPEIERSGKFTVIFWPMPPATVAPLRNDLRDAFAAVPDVQRLGHGAQQMGKQFVRRNGRAVLACRLVTG